MQRRRDEVVAERVHRHQRGQTDRVAEVVRVDAARERRARGRLSGDVADLVLAAQRPADEREHQPGEVGATSDAADDHVRVGVRELELLHRLLPDHGLVQEHVVEHGAERVVGVLALRRHFHGLGDRDPERARRVAGLRAAGLGAIRRRAVHGRAPGLHHRAPVGLLVVAGTDHVDLALEPEERARERQRRTPLARAGLGDEVRDPGLRVLVGLRHGRVRLVRAGGRDALVLVEELRGRAEGLLEAMRAEQRRRAPQPVRVTHGVGDRDLRLAAHLLPDQGHREQRRQVLRTGGLAGAGVQRRQWLTR